MKTKKVLSALLAFVMILCMCNVIAFAADGDNVEPVAQIGNVKYETLEAAIADAKDGETVTLLANCAGNGIKVPQGKFTAGLTVDFAGFTYTVDGATVGSAGTETNAFQLLKDNKITFANGTITSTKAKILLQNYSDLTLEGMTLTLNNPNYASAYTLSNNNGDIVIDGTTINANPAGGFAFDVCRYASYTSVNVEVKGNSVINGNVEISASGSDAKDGFGLTLTSGTMTGEIVVDSSAKAAMEAAPEKTSVAKASAFEQEAPEGYEWVDDGNGSSTLVEVAYVAQIGNVKYETLEAAITAAKDGEKVTLLADCAGNGIKVPQGKFTAGLTVDFAGFTYTVDGSLVGSTGTETQAFQLLKDNKITFANGTITSTKAKILLQNYSDLTLEGMTLTLNNPNYTSAYTLSNNNGDIVIDGTTINANPAGGFAFDVCRYASYTSVNVEVKGNSVINGDVEISASGSDAKDGFGLTLTSGTMKGKIVVDSSAKAAMKAAPKKTSVVKASAFEQEAPEGYEWVDGYNGISTLVEVAYVAKIGNVKYETLEAAITAAKDGEKVTLLKNCAGNGIKVPKGKFTEGLTIDFAGFTYTVDGSLVGSTGTETQAFQLLKDNKITFANGTITSTKAKILLQNYSDLTLEGMTLTLNNPNYTSAYTLSNNNGDIVIDGTTINANPAGGFAFDVCRYASYTSVNVEVKGNSVINGDVEISASGSDAKDGFGLTLTSGTMKGKIVVDSSAKAAMKAAPKKTSVVKASAFEQEAPEGYEWVDDGNGISTLVEVAYVAKIGNVKYETLEAAITAAKDGEKVTLLKNCAGNGIKVPKGKFTEGLTIDFAGFTYTVDGSLVGSTGTETQAFQLLKDNKITFANGTITSTKAKILLQNYSDLTLEGMTLTLNNPNYTSAYTLSNNNGDIVIDGTTINANPAGGFAFDVCRFSSYTSVNVEVKGNSVINGDVEIFASGSDAKDGFGLTLTSGTMKGKIVVDSSAKAAMEAAPEKTSVVKASTFEQEAPEGYEWVDGYNGISTLEAINYLEVLGSYADKMKIRLDSGDGSKTLTLLPNSGETLQPMKAYVSVYNANGTIKLVKVYEGVADNNGNTKITIAEPSVENGESCKIMLWDAKFAPVIKAIIK